MAGETHHVPTRRQPNAVDIIGLVPFGLGAGSPRDGAQAAMRAERKCRHSICVQAPVEIDSKKSCRVAQAGGGGNLRAASIYIVR
jgi:hypothetical protein